MLDNALRYTPPQDWVEVQLRRNGATLEFAVADSGVGIAADGLPRVFERFFRADRSRSRATRGSGLGLVHREAPCREASGTLKAESTLGSGSVFSFRLPATKAREASPTTEAVPI